MIEFIVTTGTAKCLREKELEEEAEWRNKAWIIEYARLERDVDGNGRKAAYNDEERKETNGEGRHCQRKTREVTRVYNQMRSNSKNQWIGVSFKATPRSRSGDKSHGEHTGASP